ncbi:MAG TPA: sugar phosphate nucleotidyltransferase [Pseudoneobacillus sp.]|nr:sugar phosphate nucleotidyltransferase [Pseudoneobacillus sp.]
MNFKGIILAGGRGSRLSPLTDITNKFLMPVYDKLMIEYSVWSLVNAGITEIAVVLGIKSAGETMDYLKSGKQYGCKFTYFYQDEPLGAAHALYQAKDFAGDSPIVVMCADNVLYDDIKPLVDKFKGGAYITTKGFTDEEVLRRFAVLDFNQETGNVSNIIEKPLDPPSGFAFCGIQIYDNDVWGVIEGLRPSSRGEYEITHILKSYIKSNKFGWDILKKPWFDCGDKDSLFEAQHYAYLFSNTQETE